ncbi:hypothetical protein [Brytella acorum]|uniref:Uncharacterized protein n=1 Tax=Brytella acorum TaxID=2959299 RepID=A0AA35Y5Q8_9PROT|nr:hypothetical protein [Brytella acorum]CAI9122284.1 hypothetical protein LMG32879_003144 [Brytella acorum]
MDMSAASASANYSGSVPRTIAQKWGDRYNLADLGAKLDGSASDAAIIQSIYDDLPTNSLVEVPKNSRWDGKIKIPDPNKYITWLFDGHIGGFYPSPGGDGDVNITLSQGLYVGMVSKSAKHMNRPINALFWNMNSNFCGASCKNYAQYPAINASAISGPTSSGNTSAVNAELDSYGNTPSTAYDVGLNVFVKKMGQNSVWGIVDDIQDLSGKSPGAFGSWNEFDLWANGADIPTFDPSYGILQSGHRSIFYIAGSHIILPSWKARRHVTAWSAGQYDRPEPTSIQVRINNVPWLWYAVQPGTTGTINPHFPAPTQAVASYDGATTLSVSSIISGIISIGDYVTAAQPVRPFQIIAQLRGNPGGPGTYQIALDTGDMKESSFRSEGVYIAPRITDGTAVWQFGERYYQTIGSVLWLSSNTKEIGDGYDTVVGGDSSVRVDNAWLDSTSSSMGQNGAAVVRMKSGQPIDFTGNGTLAGRNKHTLSYSSGVGLSYTSLGFPVFGIHDDGSQQTGCSTPSAAGTTINDATIVGGPFIVVSASADAQGVKVDANMHDEGTSRTVVNGSSYKLYVYPINKNWAFIGKTAGSGILIPAYASVKLTTVSKYNHTIYAEYHPAVP